MTFLGSPSREDRIHYAKTYDEAIRVMSNKLSQISRGWERENKTEYNEFVNDFHTMRERWNVARGAFNISTGDPPASYERMRRAVRKNLEGAYQKGDYQDLYNRLSEKAGGFGYSIEPMPRDFDLVVIKTVDTATKQLEKTATDLTPLIVGGVLATALLTLLARRGF